MNQAQEKTSIFTCACGKQIDSGLPERAAIPIGAMQDKLHWKWVALHDGKSLWLCTECSAKASDLAKQLIEVIGTPYFSIHSVVLKDK